jgi:hypothetical protein
MLVLTNRRRIAFLSAAVVADLAEVFMRNVVFSIVAKTKWLEPPQKGSKQGMQQLL